MGVYLFNEESDGGAYDEVFRQNAVERAAPMRFRSDERLKAIVQDAAFAYDTMASAITIINWRKQIVLTSSGASPDMVAREDAICNTTIQQPGKPLVVHDAGADPRFSGTALVRLQPHIRFYAGVAIVDGAGYPLGALCVFDHRAREAEVDTFALSVLARKVETIICR